MLMHILEKKHKSLIEISREKAELAEAAADVEAAALRRECVRVPIGRG
jgi:hypothetical protein